MARVTIEDCLDKVPNRFALTLLVAKRAQKLMDSGGLPFVPLDNDKPIVVALREIAAGFVTVDSLGIGHVVNVHASVDEG